MSVQNAVMWNRTRTAAADIGAVLTAALCFAAAALINGYPLVFSDSSSYIGMAAQGYVHFARPIFYSLLLMPAHIAGTLWLPIAVQCLLLAHPLHVVWRTTAGFVTPTGFVLTALVLALGTGLPWFTGQLMPDAFTAAVVLGFYLVGLRWQDLRRWERIWFVLLTAGAVAVHMSHLLLGAGLVFVIALARVVMSGDRRERKIALLPAAMSLGLALAAHVAFGAVAQGRAGPSPQTAIFLMARGIADGPTKAYLAEVCPAAGYRMCDFVDVLPDDSDVFLWGRPGDPEPSLFEQAGTVALAGEAATIVRRSWQRDPVGHIAAMLRNGWDQFFTFRSGDGLQPLRGLTTGMAYGDYWTSRKVAEHFPDEYARYLGSRQAGSALPLASMNALHVPLAWLGMGVSLLLALMCLRRGRRGAVWLFVLILAAGIGNAVITGGMSTIHDRYQSRVVWLFVAYPMIAVAALLSSTGRLREARPAGIAGPGSAQGDNSVGCGDPALMNLVR